MVMKPAWLEGLMSETLFAGCWAHKNRRKNEKNIFCLDCCQSFCLHCLPSHRSHPLLQPYTINSAKVIFLNQRAQSRSCKGSTNVCFNCDRILQDPFRSCSREKQDVAAKRECMKKFSFSHRERRNYQNMGSGRWSNQTKEWILNHAEEEK